MTKSASGVQLQRKTLVYGIVYRTAASTMTRLRFFVRLLATPLLPTNKRTDEPLLPITVFVRK